MNLKINFDELKSVSSVVGHKGEEMQELLTRINQINNELKSEWEGQDASKYSLAVEEQAKTVQKLINTINEISQFLSKASDTYRQVMEDNASGIR